VESTYKLVLAGGWADGLGYRVHLANTRPIVSIRRAEVYNDDSMRVGWRNCYDWVCYPRAISIPKRNEPSVICLRKRSQLVRQRTSNLLSVQNLLARNRGDSLGANAINYKQKKDDKLTQTKLQQTIPLDAVTIEKLSAGAPQFVSFMFGLGASVC